VSAPSLGPIVRALGGDLWAGGRRANVPAPGHSPQDRSISLLLDGDRVVAHGFGRTGWQEVLADLHARGLVDAAGRLTGAEPSEAAAPPPSPAARSRIARQLWSEGQDLAGTLAERHLRRRAVRRGSAALRFHPSVPAAVYAGHGLRRPALLALVQDVAGAPCAVEITYLGPDGARAAITLARKTIGVLPPGAAVQLDPPGPELLVAEGVFTALSAAERFQRPAWALLSAARLPVWRPPPEVASVLVAGDRGVAGEGAAEALATALGREGRPVRLLWPPQPFEDWNAAAAAAAREGRTGRGRAPGSAGPETCHAQSS